MAKFQVKMPTGLIKEIEKLEKDTEKICGEMVKAGAQVAYKNVLNNLPPSLKKFTKPQVMALLMLKLW